MKEHRAKNPEADRERQRAYRAANPEKVREWERTKYETHKDEIRRASKETYERLKKENPELLRQWNQTSYERRKANYNAMKRQFAKDHPEEARAMWKRRRERDWQSRRTVEHRRRANELGASGSHTTAEWRQRLEDFNHACAYCGKAVTGRQAHKDHIIALSRGGTNDAANLAVACRSCNSRKGNRDLHEFLACILAEGYSVHPLVRERTELSKN